MEAWLKCKVSPGQFSVEYAVQAESYDGRDFSLFAPAESVEVEREPSKGETIDGWLRVDVDTRQEELVLVRLPQQAFGNGQYVTVRAEQLQERRSRQQV